MQVGQAAVLDQRQRALEHGVGFGWKAGNNVSAQRTVRATAAQLSRELDRVVAQVPSLHPLEHQIIPGLQAQVKVRHQPGFLGHQPEQVVVHFHRVE